jgi:fructosamine-3-kinase
MDEPTAEAVTDWADCPVDRVSELDGGQVGSVHRADLADGRRVVVKTADTGLRTEAEMLAHLRSVGGLRVPEVFYATVDLLVMEFVPGDSTVTPAVERDLAERLAELGDDLPGLLDHDPTPSLVHGDVWSSNLLTDGDSVRAFLDPACYYVDREVELADAEWAGVAGDAFFEQYREGAGIDQGYDTRRHVYRLYPLVTHLRHFGREYLEPLDATLDRLGY